MDMGMALGLGTCVNPKYPMLGRAPTYVNREQ
jgi:hypothetical protein